MSYIETKDCFFWHLEQNDILVKLLLTTLHVLLLRSQSHWQTQTCTQ